MYGMSRRESFKNLSDSFSSQKSIRTDTKVVARNNTSLLFEKSDSSKSVDDLKKELSRLTTTARKSSIDKSGISLKKSTTFNQSSSRKIEKSPKSNKNLSAKNGGINRMDSKNSIVARGTTATLIKNNLSSTEYNNSNDRNQLDDEQLHQKWLENRNYLLENPFTLEGFETDPPRSSTSIQCCCHNKVSRQTGKFIKCCNQCEFIKITELSWLLHQTEYALSKSRFQAFTIEYIIGHQTNRLIVEVLQSG